MGQIKEFWNRGWVGKVVILGGSAVALVVVCCVALVALAVLVPSPRQQPVAAVATIQAVTAAPEPTSAPTANTPAPTNTPVPTAPPVSTIVVQPTVTSAPADPAASLRSGIVNTLGESNRNVERVLAVEYDPSNPDGQILVRWSINDNITEDLTRAGAQLDVKNILKAIADSGVDYGTILVEGLFPLVDQLGNVKEYEVVKARYPKTTIDQINWANFLHANVYKIAETAIIHPTFRREQ